MNLLHIEEQWMNDNTLLESVHVLVTRNMGCFQCLDHNYIFLLPTHQVNEEKEFVHHSIKTLHVASSEDHFLIKTILPLDAPFSFDAPVA